MAKKSKQPDKEKKNLVVKSYNLTYNEVRSISEEIRINKSNEACVTFSNLCRSMIEDLKAKAVRDAKNSPKKGEGRKLPYLVKMSNKLIKEMKKSLDGEIYSTLYDKGFFRLDSLECMTSTMPHSFRDELGLVSSEIEYFFKDKDSEYVVSKSPFIDLAKSLTGGSNSIKLLTKTYVNNHGLFNSVPIPPEYGDEIKDFLLDSSSSEAKEYATAFLRQPIDGSIGGLKKLVNPKDSSYGRTYIEGSTFIPENHKDDVFLSQKMISESLSDDWKTLKEIETQERKVGPRFSESSNGFWKSVAAQYQIPTMSETAKANFNKSAEELTAKIIEKVGGKLEPWPLLAGVTSSFELQVIAEAIYSGSKKVADEALEAWGRILECSSQIECVYSSIKKNTSKGAPYHTSKITSMEWLHLAIAYYQRLENPCLADCSTPFVVGERIQNSTPKLDGTIKKRHRAIMMVPAIFLEQQSFNLPLMEALKEEIPEFASYVSHENVGIELEKQLRYYLDNDEELFCLSLDYSQYDTRVSAEMQEDGLWKLLSSIYKVPQFIQDQVKSVGIETAVNERYLSNIAFNTENENTVDFNHELYLSDMFLSYWRTFYTEVPLLIPGGIKTGKHGLFSGAPGTTHIGSLLNWIRTNAVAKELELEVVTSMYQGDDTLLAYKKSKDNNTDLTSWSKHMSEYGHIVAIDPVKQAYMSTLEEKSPYFMFVGKYFFIKGIEKDKLFKDIYCISDMIARFYYPEGNKIGEAEGIIKDHFHDPDFNKYKFLYRKPPKDRPTQPSVEMAVRICQSLMNCKHHPLWKEHVVSVVKSSPGLFKPIIEVSNLEDYWDVLSSSGTLMGMSKDEFTSGIISDETIQLILETLKTVEHEYIDTIFIEDLQLKIKKARVTKKKLSIGEKIDKSSSDHDFPNKEEILNELADICNGNAYKDLMKLL